MPRFGPLSDFRPTPDFTTLVTISCLLAFIAFIASYSVFNLPRFAWDFLSFWAVETIRLFESPSILESTRVWGHRHPPLIPATVAAVSQLIHVPLGTSLLLLYFIVALVPLVCLGFLVRHKKVDTVHYFVCAWLIYTVPLMENQLSNIGYAEPIIWCCCFAFFSIVVAKAPAALQLRHVVIVVLSLIVMALVKNTGIIYSLVCVVSWVAASAIIRFGLFRSLTLATFAVFVSVVLLGPEICFWGNKFGWGDGAYDLWIGGHKMRSSGAPPFLWLESWVVATFINQSFSVATIFLMVSMASVVNLRDRGIAAVLLVCVILAAGYVVGQVFEYMFVYARPGYDTGGSRILVPVYGAVPVLYLALVESLRPHGPS